MPVIQKSLAAAARLWTRYPRIAGSVLLVLLVLAAFGDAWNHNFAWDDFGLIVGNHRVTTGRQWGSLLFSNFWRIGENVEDPARSFYRPLISLSYALDHAVWGLNPRGFHVTNLAAHALCSITVFLLALSVLGRRGTALAAAALFAVHPTHTANVAWISGRTDVFCGIFFFSALGALATWLRTRQPWFLALWLSGYLLALAAKEMALSFPVIAILSIACRKEPADRKTLAVAGIPLVLITAGYLFTRYVILGHVIGPAVWGSLPQRILSLPLVFARYIELILLLVPVDPHHNDALVNSHLTGNFLWPAALALVYASLLGYGIRRRARLPILLFAWLPITLVPVLKLGTFGDVLYADRFLYIPSAGFLAGVMYAASQSAWTKPAAPRWTRMAGKVLYAVVLAVLVANSRANTRYWENNRTLFTSAAATSPQSAYVLYNLGNSLLEDGCYVDAVEAYAKVTQLAPDHAKALTNRGIALNELERHRQALICLMAARDVGDESHVLYANMAVSYRNLGQLDQAAKCLRQALALRETHTAHNNLGEVLIDLEAYEEAWQHLAKAIAMHPTSETINNMARACIKTDQPERALPLLRQALAMPTAPSPQVTVAVHYNYARALHQLGRHATALAHARKALDIAKREPSIERRNPEEIAWLHDVANGGQGDAKP